jgi:salicylate hydroxylase
MLLFFGGSGTPVHRLSSLTGEVQGGLRIEDTRSDLHSTLQEAVRTLDSEAIVLNAKVICIEEEDSGDVTVHFEDGRSDHGDLVVGADRPIFTGQVAWRCTVPTAHIPPDLRTDIVSTLALAPAG